LRIAAAARALAAHISREARQIIPEALRDVFEEVAVEPSPLPRR
jgi:hypothetical protein